MNETNKDFEQDEMIRRNAENIKRNHDAILRQTECLEKIRDHYFPRRTFMKKLSIYFAKVFGAVVVYAGFMESAGWYFNERTNESMAGLCATVANRLMFVENDPAGAKMMFEKAIALQEDESDYLLAKAQANGLAAVYDLFDLERPLTAEERRRLDDVMCEAVFLQEARPDDAMPYVLMAQVHLVRKEYDLARKAVEAALERGPDIVFAHVTAAAAAVKCGDFARAKCEITKAEKINDSFPPIWCWKGTVAVLNDHDYTAAEAAFAHVVELMPRFPAAHTLLGWAKLTNPKPDLPGARMALKRAIALGAPTAKPYVLLAQTFLLDGRPDIARHWLDLAIEKDPTCVNAFVMRAGISAAEGDYKSAISDYSAAISIDPLNSSLYSGRAKAKESAGDIAGAKIDRDTAAM